MTFPKTLAAIACLVFATTAAFAADAEAGKPAVSTLVKTQLPKPSRFDRTVTGYGSVTTDVSHTQSISAPLAGLISALRVGIGQTVSHRQPLLELTVDPNARAAYQQAASALANAKDELKRTEEQASLQLATQSQLATAKKSLLDAQATLDAQVRLGADRGSQTLSAPFDGVVTAVAAAQGDRVQAGASLLQLARTDDLLVPLGIDPEDASGIKPGMPVRLSSVFDPALHIDGRIALLQGALNGQTHLVNALARFTQKEGSSWPVGTRMRGEIVLASRNAWSLPRQAVLRDEQGAYLYQVQNGKAKRIAVTAQGESDGAVGVEATDNRFDPRLPVVVEGNYELQDGMAVREAQQ